MRQLILTGVFAQDPDLRYTQNGMAIYTFTIGGEDTVTDKDGQPKAVPFYLQCKAIGKPAEWYAERKYSQGSPVMVVGQPDYREWTTEDGKKASSVEVLVTELHDLDITPEVVQDQGGDVRMRHAINRVTVLGNLTRDPEQTSEQAPVTIGIAVNDKWTGKDKKKKEQVHYFSAEAWRELGQYLMNGKKGQRVLLEGRLFNDSWQTKDGDKRSERKIEVFTAQLLTSKGRSKGAESTSTPAAPAPSTAPAASTQEAAESSDAPFGDEMPF